MKKEIEWKKRRGKHICMACGACVASCPQGLIKPAKDRPLQMDKSKPGLTWDDMIKCNPKRCIGCGLCIKVCPEEMLKFKK